MKTVLRMISLLIVLIVASLLAMVIIAPLVLLVTSTSNPAILTVIALVICGLLFVLIRYQEQKS